MPTIHFHSLLDEEARWQIRDGHQIRVADALKQFCRANAALEVKRGEVASTFGTLVSAGCSHIAAIEIVTSLRIIKVTVYRLENGFQHEWNASYSGSEEEFRRPATLATYETDQFQGGITEDGRSVLMFFGNKAASTEAYLVNANGFTRRTPPAHIFTQYLPPTGQLSEDSEYLFYSTHGSRFGRNGQAEVVEAYSIRHLARMRAHTFGFGDGYHLRNTNLISPLRFEGAIYMTIATASFDGPDDGRRSPLVLASSDKKIQWNFADVEDSDRAFISPDNAHLFYVEHNTARLRHWDLNTPTLRALGSTILPGVEQSPRRKWLIHGKETMINDAIPEQMHYIRFSPKCKVATVVTVNDRSIAINALLTFNLQFIYHRTVHDPSWPYLIPTSIGFTESTGFNIFAMQAALITDFQQGLVGFSGIRGVLISLPEIFTKIKAIEDYFDTLGDRLTTLVKQVVSVEARPECKFEWRAGYLERDDAEAISHQSGSSPQTTGVDARRQRLFYERVYANPKSSTKMDSSPFMWRYFVPHLFSFHYRWDREKTVSVFGVVMKSTYNVIAIGPASSAADHGNEVIRILYTSDISVRAEDNEYIEVYRSGPNHFLRVYKRRNEPVGYSGAPMPSPRWTVLSPHFLEEDAWYDTFIIHQGTHVTLPNEWVQSPGSVLIESTNNRAYFEPYTYSTMSVIDYGHRARPAYTVPKYLLWKEYGLRRRRKPHVNEPWFGSGPYADIVGRYLKSIYEDKTYDESAPLFPTALALACHEDYRSQTTERVDAFFRRMHQDRDHVLNSCQAISCTLPLACRARPTASLSFMRHIVAYPHRVNDIGAVEVRDGTTVPELGGQSEWRYWVKCILDVLAGAITDRLWDENAGDAEPYVSHITLPLPDFCSFRHKLYKLPSQSERDLSGDSFWTFIRAAYPDATEGHMPYWETHVLKAVRHSGAGAASPFTRLVEMILDIQDRELQLSFLRIPWLEKLLVWKMKAFGLRMYLTRTLVPMLMLFSLHLIACIWLTEHEVREIPFPVTVLACIEALVSSSILSVKIRQIYRIPRLFFRSIFNYVDGTALCLGFTMFFLVVSKTAPSRAFLGFSTLILWIGTILMLRIYRPIGMLLLLITETVQATFSFLVLLVFIIIGCVPLRRSHLMHF